MKHLGIKRLSSKDIETICMYCNRIKNSDNQWDSKSPDKEQKALSHGICPDCLESVWKAEVVTALGLSTVALGTIAKVGATIATS